MAISSASYCDLHNDPSLSLWPLSVILLQIILFRILSRSESVYRVYACLSKHSSLGVSYCVATFEEHDKYECGERVV